MTIPSFHFSDVNLLFFILIWRFLNAILTFTFFQADEFWQALEPAHLMAFGYGQLTWEWKFGLRSYAFPFLFELGYRFVNLHLTLIRASVPTVIAISKMLPVKPDLQHSLEFYIERMIKNFEYYSIIVMPKIIMSIVAAVGEYYMVRWIEKIYILTLNKTNDNKSTERISNVRTISFLLTLTNFFNCFVLTRTFVNSFEMCLTTVALFYWDWSDGSQIQSNSFTISLMIAIFTCLQRPSNGLIWVCLGGFLFIRQLTTQNNARARNLIFKVFVVFSGSILFNASIDYYFYGEVVFPIFKFLKFNFFTPLSTFYGVAPWHFHIVQSLPIMLGYNIPLFIYGMLSSLSNKTYAKRWWCPFFQIKFTVIFNIMIYSLLKHKEFRFIYPLQPFFTLIATCSAIKFTTEHASHTELFRKLICILSSISVFSAAIFNIFLERGVVSVMRDLHGQTDVGSVGFIMPCHSTPWQSHLHRSDIRDLWSISCDPPLHLLDNPYAGDQLLKYMDESDILYDNIPEFINDMFPPLKSDDHMGTRREEFKYEWPDYLVIFEHLDKLYMKSFLDGSSYVPYRRYFNTFSHWDGRRDGDVIVYRKSS